MWTLVRKTARTDKPATTEAASAPEPASQSPVETAEDEIADKAEELNIEAIMAVEPAALDPTKRRLELWDQSTSRKVMIQVLSNRVCFDHCVQITVPETGASGRDVPKSHCSLTLLERNASASRL